MFACVPCTLAFSSSEEQVAHLKSDYHNYNLRRRVAGYDPVLESEYEYKKELLQQAESAVIKKAKPVKEKVVEEPKTYRSTLSLFCGHESASFEKNLEFMREHYSFKIPDEEYCTDVQGLVQHLGEQVYGEFTCLYCMKTMPGLTGVFNHMRDKGHRRIGMDYEEQLIGYADYYDYSKSYLKMNLPEHIVEEIEALQDEDWEMVQDITEEEEEIDSKYVMLQKEKTAGINKPESAEINQQIKELIQRNMAQRTASGDLWLPASNKTIVNRKCLSEVAEDIAVPAKPVNPRLRLALQSKSHQELTKDQQMMLKKIMVGIKYEQNKKAAL